MDTEQITQDTALKGWLAKYPSARFKVYIIFAIINLVLLAATQLLVYGLIPELATDLFSRIMGWLMAVLNLAGAAFGVTAASNVNRN